MYYIPVNKKLINSTITRDPDNPYHMKNRQKQTEK